MKSVKTGLSEMSAVWFHSKVSGAIKKLLSLFILQRAREKKIIPSEHQIKETRFRKKSRKDPLEVFGGHGVGANEAEQESSDRNQVVKTRKTSELVDINIVLKCTINCVTVLTRMISKYL